MLFLTIDYFVQRARAAKEREMLQPKLWATAELPFGVTLAQNHTWAKPDEDGNLIIGLDELLARVVGPIEEIILPTVDAIVSPAKPSITLRQGERNLGLGLPVNGSVIEVNGRVRARPAIASHDPYGSGWLVKIHPTDGGSNGYLTFHGGKAREWLRRQNELVKEFFMPRMPSAQFATMQDGGLVADGLLQLFDADVWSDFQQAFVTLDNQASTLRGMAGEVWL
jgi:glycine cleavage system H protein